MSLFVCAKCGCVDNTATSSYWMLTNEYMVDKFEYAKELQPYKGMGLCSECGRLTTSPDGRDVVVPGKMAREVPEEESYRRADKESRIQKFNKINKENMAIIGIDFDGTCVTDLFPYVGDNIGAASVLRKLADKNLLILYTVRDGKYLQDAVDWFKYNHINLYSVNYNPEPVSSSPKLYCDYYIDDRNIGTPLTDKGYVDWNKMLVLLRQKNLL